MTLAFLVFLVVNVVTLYVIKNLPSTGQLVFCPLYIPVLSWLCNICLFVEIGFQENFSQLVMDVIMMCG